MRKWGLYIYKMMDIFAKPVDSYATHNDMYSALADTGNKLSFESAYIKER